MFSWLSYLEATWHWHVNWVIACVCLIVAIDILRWHRTARNLRRVVFVPLKRFTVWLVGTLLAFILLIASPWPFHGQGLADPEISTQAVSRPSDWDDHVTMLTITTAPSKIARKEVPTEKIEQSAVKMLNRSTTAFDSALALMGRDRGKESIKLIGREIARVETNGDQPHLIPRLLYFRAMAYSLGDYDSLALEDYDRAIARAPLYAEAHMNRAFLLLKMKRFPEARSSLLMALRYADERTYPCLLGIAYLELGDASQAIHYFDQALAKGFEYPEARALSSKAALQLEFNGRSTTDANASLAADPTNSLAWSQKAVLYGLLKNMDSLRESLDKAYGPEADTCDVLIQGALAFIKAKEYKLAEARLDSTLATCENNYHAWYYAAYVYNELEMHTEAVECVNNAIRGEETGTGEALALLSVILYKTKSDLDLCLNYVDSAFQVGSRLNPALAWVIKGETLLKLNQTDSAAVAFDSALTMSISKKQPQLGFRIASGLHVSGEDGRALDAVDLALTYDPKWPEALALKQTLQGQTDS